MGLGYLKCARIITVLTRIVGNVEKTLDAEPSTSVLVVYFY